MNDFKKEFDQIKIPEKKLDKAINKGMKRGATSRHRGIGKKIAIISTAAILLLTLFVSTSFVSPVMANFFSSIPFVNKVIEPGGNLVEEIDDNLKKNKITAQYTSVSYKPNKIIEIGVRSSESKFQTLNQEINDIVNQVLGENGYNAFSINVLRLDSRENTNEPNINKEEQKLNDQVISVLKKHDIYISAYGILLDKKEINLEIETSKKYYNDIKNNAEDITRKVLIANDYKGYMINIKRKDNADQKWANKILPAIGQELMAKKGYNVTSVSYSLEEKPTIIVKTSFSGSTQFLKKTGAKIEDNVNEILSSDYIKSILNKQSPQINVYSEGQVKIN